MPLSRILQDRVSNGSIYTISDFGRAIISDTTHIFLSFSNRLFTQYVGHMNDHEGSGNCREPMIV